MIAARGANSMAMDRLIPTKQGDHYSRSSWFILYDHVMHLFTDTHTPNTMPWMLAGATLTHNDTRLCFSDRSIQSRMFMGIELLVDMG